MRDLRTFPHHSVFAALALSCCLSTAALAQSDNGAVQVASAKQTKRSSSSLSSRGAALHSLPALKSVAKAAVDDSTIPGRVGVVRVASASIRAGRKAGDKALAIVTEGTNLALLMEKEGYYGVLMQDSTLGWLPTNQVELLDYRVQIKIPDAAPEPVAAAPAPETGVTPELNVSDPRAAGLIQEAFTYLGVPYVWAGNTRKGLDCSAFVKNVFATARGISLPRHSGDQAKYGTEVASTDDLQPGDRLYFDMGRKGRISHCGIYLGNGYFIHASSNRHCVGVDRLATPNYWKALVAARHDG